MRTSNKFIAFGLVVFKLMLLHYYFSDHLHVHGRSKIFIAVHCSFFNIYSTGKVWVCNENLSNRNYNSVRVISTFFKRRRTDRPGGFFNIEIGRIDSIEPSKTPFNLIYQFPCIGQFQISTWSVSNDDNSNRVFDSISVKTVCCLYFWLPAECCIHVTNLFITRLCQVLAKRPLNLCNVTCPLIRRCRGKVNDKIKSRTNSFGIESNGFPNRLTVQLTETQH